jgi:hypothetical protein
VKLRIVWVDRSLTCVNVVGLWRVCSSLCVSVCVLSSVIRNAQRISQWKAKRYEAVEDIKTCVETQTDDRIPITDESTQTETHSAEQALHNPTFVRLYMFSMASGFLPHR